MPALPELFIRAGVGAGVGHVDVGMGVGVCIAVAKAGYYILLVYVDVGYC